MKYKIKEYAAKNKVQYRTVWNWMKAGKLKYERTGTGRIIIVDEDEHKDKKVAVYARVSSSENKDNLGRQKERLINFCNAKGYKVSKIVTEIGSGLNDHRPKLESLLMDNSIDVIVVEHTDRFARFGANYLIKLLEKAGRTVEIINPPENDRDDLMEDFVSIITSFTARLYGQRRSKRHTEKLLASLESNHE